ncbi:MAG: HAD hydrolase family protein [Saprospiraceae bacterium]|nr:HAD hydrolase family protein [Saprospiraceae bacterium]MBK8632801.1 HAD hydrolase family protein [Saprospiraceae bacterium]MBP7643097.1 HAD hydrolase family protein [Saprospiraceae bacterium]
MNGEIINNHKPQLLIDHSKFNAITTFIFDVDGVFTDGSLLVTEQGEFLRIMNTRDGQGIKFALDAGYKVFVITKGASTGVKKRFQLLGLTEIFDMVQDKGIALSEIKDRYQIGQDEILFMGDDIPDLLIFPFVGISACPADAANDVLCKADYISPLEGGKGCVREIVEKVMRIQDKWVV